MISDRKPDGRNTAVELAALGVVRPGIICPPLSKTETDRLFDILDERFRRFAGVSLKDYAR